MSIIFLTDRQTGRQTNRQTIQCRDTLIGSMNCGKSMKKCIFKNDKRLPIKQFQEKPNRQTETNTKQTRQWRFKINRHSNNYIRNIDREKSAKNAKNV
jgi:hypothetical protein